MLLPLTVNNAHNNKGAVKDEKQGKDCTTLQAVLIREASLYCHHLGVDLLPAVGLLLLPDQLV